MCGRERERERETECVCTCIKDLIVGVSYYVYYELCNCVVSLC